MAEFKQNEIYFGFRLQKIEEINDIHSTAYLFSHEKSGARLLYLKNADHNKVFNVVFKTPPENDCGTPHILEPVSYTHLDVYKRQLRTYVRLHGSPEPHS